MEGGGILSAAALFLLGTLQALHAQKNPFLEQIRNFPQEKIHVTTDRDAYIAGDTAHGEPLRLRGASHDGQPARAPHQDSATRRRLCRLPAPARDARAGRIRAVRLHALHAQPRRRLSLLETPFDQSLPTTRKTTAPHGGGPLRRGLLPRRRLPHRRTALPRGVQGPGQGRTFAAGDGNRARRPWPHRRAFRLAPRRHGVVRVHAVARPALHGRMRPDIGRQGAALRSARGQRLHLRPARRAQRHLLRRIRPFG